MKRKILFTLALGLLSALTLYAQRDSSRRIIFILNPTNSLFNLHTIEVEFPLNTTYRLRAGVGSVTAFNWWNEDNGLYNGTDDKYPTGVYNGWVSSASLVRCHAERNNYLHLNIFFKKLHYENVSFRNLVEDGDYIRWKRTEKAHVIGVKLQEGKRKVLNHHLALEFIYGFSFRLRFRSYQTVWKPNPLVYRDQKVQFFPGIQLGVSLLIGNFNMQ